MEIDFSFKLNSKQASKRVILSELKQVEIIFDGIWFIADYEKRNEVIEVSAVNGVWYEYLNQNFLKSVERLIDEQIN